MVAVVCSAGSSAALPCRDVLLFQLGTDSHLDCQRGSRQSRGSLVVVAAAAVAVRELGPGVGNAAVRAVVHTAASQVAVHIVVARVVAHIVAVYLRRRQVEGGSVVVGAQEGMTAVVGRPGLLEEARSTGAESADLFCVREYSSPGAGLQMEGFQKDNASTYLVALIFVSFTSRQLLHATYEDNSFHPAAESLDIQTCSDLHSRPRGGQLEGWLNRSFECSRRSLAINTRKIKTKIKGRVIGRRGDDIGFTAWSY